MRWFRRKLPLLVILLATLLVAKEGMCWHEHVEPSQEVVSVQQQQDHNQLPSDSDGCCHCLACHHNHFVAFPVTEMVTAHRPLVMGYALADTSAPDGIARSIDYPPQLVA